MAEPASCVSSLLSLPLSVFLSLLVLLSFSPSPSLAFYLPGIAPVDYEDGAQIPVFANKFTSPMNHVPYDYYQLPMCKPVGQEDKKKIKNSQGLNIGQILTGEKMKPTHYEVFMNTPEKCKILCEKVVTEQQVEQLQRRIDDGYRIRLDMDNMPNVRKVIFEGDSDPTYFLGTELGFIDNGRYFVNNHLDINVLIHKPTFSSMDIYQPGDELHRVVGFEAKGSSFSFSPGETANYKCDSNQPLELIQASTKTILFSYSITFEESPIRWATRWDPLLKATATERKIQWFSIINSVVVSLVMTLVVALILLRTIFKDFARYNRLEENESVQEDFGWKLVHGEVFRPPSFFGVLCVFFGAGVQIFFISSIILIFALFGFLSPANRGGLLTVLLFVLVLTTIINGFASARLYVGMGGESKRAVTTGASLFYSTLIFGTFFVLNTLGYFAKSSSAVPFFTLVMLFLIWFGLSIPLSVLGAYLGYRSDPFTLPTKVSQIPRTIPEGVTVSTVSSCILAGLFPFFVSFVQLIFLLNSLWQGAIFYMFGFLTIVFGLVILSTIEVSIIVTYFALSAEDYRWWWPSFAAGASSGFYVFFYCIYYLHTEIGWKRHFVSSCMIFGYTFLIATTFSFMLGAIGLLCAFFFVKKIYASIRID